MYNIKCNSLSFVFQPFSCIIGNMINMYLLSYFFSVSFVHEGNEYRISYIIMLSTDNGPCAKRLFEIEK